MIPEHITDAVEVLRAAGWVEPSEAVTATGRSIAELVLLTESGELGMIQLGPWWDGDVPRVVNLLQLARLEAAPRRAPLYAIGSGR